MSGSELDVIGVGLGPFNLGLAALLEPVSDVRAAFFERSAGFAWHPGLLLPGATLQVPFLADLATLADPTSRYSFLNYLHRRGRLYRFYFYEQFHVARREYDAYARWVAEQLPACQFGHRVEAVRPGKSGRWTVTVAGPDNSVDEYQARAVVLGVGTRPSVPLVARELVGDDVFHSADYLTYRAKTVAADAVTVVGSGQSAGEIVADLLEAQLSGGWEAAPTGAGSFPASGERRWQRLDWFTRSAGFLPMEYSKLGLEHFTPEYTAYFHGLPAPVRDRVRAGQDLLYKGLSAETSARIYDLLYDATIEADDPPVTYAARCELTSIEPSPEPGRRWRLTWRQVDQGPTFVRDTDVVVLATGYEPAPLPVAPELLSTDEHGRPVIGADYSVLLRDGAPSTLYVQNAELHTHGVGAPDLGLGAHRNAVIVNALAGREVYPVRSRTVFQQFGAPV